MTEYRYRYEDGSCAPSVHLQQLQVLRRTERGAWVRVSRWTDPREERFVLDGPGKRYAHETPELAADYYRARKKSSIRKFAHRLRRQEAFSCHAERMLQEGKPLETAPHPGEFFEFEE